MILAKRDSDWFLAAFAPHIRGCNLSINHRPQTRLSAFHEYRPGIWVQSHAPLDGITFYPELRWNGIKVRPERWDQEAEEPILLCIIYLPDTNEIVEAMTGVTMETILEIEKSGDRERWGELVRDNQKAGKEFRESLVESGWGIGMDLSMYERYVHVDELEKIEGPPPAGPF